MSRPVAVSSARMGSAGTISLVIARHCAEIPKVVIAPERVPLPSGASHPEAPRGIMTSSCHLRGTAAASSSWQEERRPRSSRQAVSVCGVSCCAGPRHRSIHTSNRARWSPDPSTRSTGTRRSAGPSPTRRGMPSAQRCPCPLCSTATTPITKLPSVISTCKTRKPNLSTAIRYRRSRLPPSTEATRTGTAEQMATIQSACSYTSSFRSFTAGASSRNASTCWAGQWVATARCSSARPTHIWSRGSRPRVQRSGPATGRHRVPTQPRSTRRQIGKTTASSVIFATSLVSRFESTAASPTLSSSRPKTSLDCCQRVPSISNRVVTVSASGKHAVALSCASSRRSSRRRAESDP